MSCPELLGGSAHSSSPAPALTLWSGAQGRQQDQRRQQLVYYGVREFSMAAIANGVAPRRLLITCRHLPDVQRYARNALRMAARLVKVRRIFVFCPRLESASAGRPNPPAGGTDPRRCA